MNDNSLSETIEDHALERVPDDQRQGWLALTWNTAGVVVSLVQLFFGALVTFVAGFQAALVAGLIVMLICWPLSWASSHVAYRTGLSSTVMSRYFGFGKKGSIISSIIYSFMIIGFLALENALLYRGFLFYFKLSDTLTTKILIYGLMTVLWIILTSYGFKLIARASSITLTLSLVVLAYITYLVVSNGDRSVESLVSFGPQFSHDVLKGMGADSPTGRFIFAINVLIGSAGGMAMFGADIGRYARRSKDVGISTLIGLLSLDILMLWLGGIIMYAGGPALVDFYTQTAGMTHEAAQRASLESPDSIVAAFVVLGGAMGAWLLVLAQGKTQVLNNYAASLSLSNLFDALNLRMGRLTFVVLANVIGLLMLYGSILELIDSWVTILGVLVTAFAGIVVADYYIVKTLLAREPKAVQEEPENVNWAGVVTLLVSAFMAHYVLASILPIQAITTLIISILLYPLLRTTVLKPTWRGSGHLPEAIDDPVAILDGAPAAAPSQVS
jgi:cytosine permease